MIEWVNIFKKSDLLKLVRGDSLCDFQSPPVFYLLERYGKPVTKDTLPKFCEPRSVTEVKSTGLVFTTPSGKTSFLELDRASLMTYGIGRLGNNSEEFLLLAIYEPGIRLLSLEEKNKMKKDISLYKQGFITKKDLSKACKEKLRFTCEGISSNPDGSIRFITKDVKGNMSLLYRIILDM